MSQSKIYVPPEIIRKILKYTGEYILFGKQILDITYILRKRKFDYFYFCCGLMITNGVFIIPGRKSIIINLRFIKDPYEIKGYK